MCNGHQTLALFSNWILCDGSLEDSLLIWDETVEILLSTIIYYYTDILYIIYKHTLWVTLHLLFWLNVLW